MNSGIEQHYSRKQLFEKIIAAFEHAGIDKNKITRKDLSLADEFHVRGMEVTREMAGAAGLHKDMKVLDVGCGIGGPGRLLADEYGCHVTGIDITSEYIRTAVLLSELTGLQDRTHFVEGDALQLPFDSATFDVVWTQHVQMNIENKKQFYSEINRVLTPGGSFFYYDIFRMGKQTIHFPVPWAETASLNHLITIDELHSIFTTTALAIVGTTDQTTKGINFLQALLQKITKDELPPVSLQLLIGDSFPVKLSNLLNNFLEKKIILESGKCRKN